MQIVSLELTRETASRGFKERADEAASTMLNRRPNQHPHILLATTGHLPSTARLAMELFDAGAQVSLLAPRSHPARVLDLFSNQLLYRASAPAAALNAALSRLRPDLVIPCDERTVRDLHAVCRQTRDQQIRDLIQASTAPIGSFTTVASRADLLALAEREGVRVPASAPVDNREALRDWVRTHPAPFVLKADGSWSGFGVRVISNAANAETAFAEMTRPAGLKLAIREAVLEGDHFGFRSWVRRERPSMSVQSFVDGWPANIGVACWRGEVLATTCAEAVSTVSATGPSTAARIIQNPEMVEAARKIVRALGLSGLIGFDFMIEAATGAAYLIEMNPRNTPICALRLSEGRDLTEALVARLSNRPMRERPPRTERDIVVFFPDTWSRDPSNHLLHSAYHDVPWEQPNLVRVLVQPERRERYLIFRMLRPLWLALQGGDRGMN